MELSEVVDRARILIKSNSNEIAISAVNTKFTGSAKGTASPQNRNIHERRTCFICGLPGHLARSCPSRQTSFIKRCYVCGQPDHLAPVCPKKIDLTSKNE